MCCDCDTDSDLSDDDDSDVLPVTRGQSTHIVSDSERSESDDAEWHEIDKTPLLETFLGELSIKCLPADHTNILDIVDIHFGNDLFIHFVEESNRYHDQNIDKFKVEKSPKSRKILVWER